MTEKHAVTLVRHDVRRRLLTVKTAERLTPNMARITLTGDDLPGFISAGYDDHMKLFFPLPGQAEPVYPPGPDAPPLPDGVQASPMRDYTPRRYDAEAGELIIDFAIHDAGSATEWADAARPGQKLGVGGPRGSFVVTDDFDWYLLAGDETALPAIGRRLEELRRGARAIVVGLVTGPEEEQVFDSAAQLEVHWVHRPLEQMADAAPLLDAVSALTFPPGDGYAWVAGESATAKILRHHLVVERGLNKAWVKAAGYWRAGGVGVHETFND